MGKEPNQGMEGKQEQGQPWAKSQIKGWKAGAGTAMGREPKQGTDGKQEQGNRGKCLRTERTAARQQGQVLTHGTDSSKTTGASAYARDGQQGSRGREPSQGAEGSRAAWAESLRKVRKAAGQHGQRAFARCGRQQGSMGREPSQGSVGNRAAGQRAFAGVGRLKKKSLYIIACGRKNGRCFCKQKNAVF